MAKLLKLPSNRYQLLQTQFTTLERLVTNHTRIKLPIASANGHEFGFEHSAVYFSKVKRSIKGTIFSNSPRKLSSDSPEYNMPVMHIVDHFVVLIEKDSGRA